MKIKTKSKSEDENLPVLDQIVSQTSGHWLRDVMKLKKRRSQGFSLQLSPACPVTDLHGVVTEGGDEDVTLTLPQTIQQRAQRGQLRHLHTRYTQSSLYLYYDKVLCV